MKTIVLCLFLLFTGSTLTHDRTCVKGDIAYSIADYKDEFQPQYAHVFEAWFSKPLLQFFCDQEIKNLPAVNKNKSGKVTPSLHYVIEPLCVDLSTFNGIYAKRIYSLEPKARSARYTCGYYHYVFILSDKEYTELTEDTLVNEALIQNKLKASFSAQEIQQMTAYYKYDVLCDNLLFLPPSYVKRGDSILFDAGKEHK